MDKNIIHKGGFHRRSIRIPGFDYCSEGSYFITIVTRNRYPLFGEIIAGDLRLTQLGQIAQDCWREIPSHFSSAEIDEFVIMPNHIHGILNLINDESDAVEIKVVKSENFSKPVCGSIPTIIRTYKAAVTRLSTRQLGIREVWHRNYYEHIIGSDREYESVAEYINSNPQNWETDQEYRLS